MFNQMNQDAQKMETVVEKDSFGGNLQPTGLQKAVIDIAYVTNSAKSNAAMFNIVFKTDDGATLRMSECIISGDEKGNKPYYIDKKTKKEVPLPGFTTISTICTLLIGKGLNEFTDADAVVKTIKLYDSKQSKEVPTDVKVIEALCGKKVQIGVLQVRGNKQDTNYNDTSEERVYNRIDKVFDEKGFTATELQAQLEAPEWINAWAEKYGTAQVDEYKEVKPKAGMGAPKSGTSMFANNSGETKPTNSLFGNQNTESE